MENRVVITGLGIWSSLGTSLGEVTESLREGRSGIGLDPERRELGYISALTGIVKRPELKGALDLDSLDLVDVVVLVDKNFGVTLTGPDFKELKTFQDFYDLIISRTNGK